MSEEQLAFHIEEFVQLRYQCEQCGTVILFDLAIHDQFGLPAKCPTCGQAMPELVTAIQTYRQFYTTAKQAKGRMQLCTRPEVRVKA